MVGELAIEYAQTSDGVRIAYSVTGAGPGLPVVFVGAFPGDDVLISGAFPLSDSARTMGERPVGRRSRCGTKRTAATCFSCSPR